MALDLTGVEDRDEVVVPDARGRARLVDEPPAVGVVAGEIGLQDLQRDLGAVVGAEGAEDLRHRALAEGLAEPVGPERPALVRPVRAGG